MPSDDVVIVLTTFPADGDAEAFARTLVEEGLAACVNVLPAMTSIYRWKGAIETAGERQLIVKTAAATVDRLQSRLKELHPYDLPEMLVLRVLDGSPDYLSWLLAETRPVNT